MAETLRVSEIYLSIQGEGTRSGLPCVMVRLAGCNLSCRWCDTTYAQGGDGREITVEQALAEVAALGRPLVELTGGEPLLQAGAGELLKRLADAGYETLLETNGSLDISAVDPRVVRIVDVKCPSSGEGGSFLESNFAALTQRDEMKFVIADRADFDYARKVVAARDLANRCEIIFSPVAGRLAPATLAKWILDEGLHVRLGIQLHRVIFPDADRGV